MKNKVFIVHGRDYPMRRNVVKYIATLGLEPVILDRQANKGNTIIEKIERCAEECVYAVVLLSPDDLGRYRDDADLKPRARQNVILEFGYMAGKLGRHKVAMMLKGDVEKPSDAQGIVHIPYNNRGGGWRVGLKNELANAGFLGEATGDGRFSKPRGVRRLN